MARPASPRRFIIAALIVAALLLTIPITLTSGLRGRLEAALSERFDSTVEMQSLRVSILPRLRVAGEGIVLRPGGRTDVPPLIAIASFSADANLWGLIGRPVRLTTVRLEGLEISVPPGGVKIDSKDENPGETRGKTQPEPPAASSEPSPSPILIDHLLAERAVVKILRRDPKKQTRVWEIAHLSMERAGSNDPWPFQAQLTNPIPPGDLEVRGTFGHGTRLARRRRRSAPPTSSAMQTSASSMASRGSSSRPVNSRACCSGSSSRARRTRRLSRSRIPARPSR